jgi:hypothetical protein
MNIPLIICLKNGDKAQRLEFCKKLKGFAIINLKQIALTMNLSNTESLLLVLKVLIKKFIYDKKNIVIDDINSMLDNDFDLFVYILNIIHTTTINCVKIVQHDFLPESIPVTQTIELEQRKIIDLEKKGEYVALNPTNIDLNIVKKILSNEKILLFSNKIIEGLDCTMHPPIFKMHEVKSILSRYNIKYAIDDEKANLWFHNGCMVFKTN